MAADPEPVASARGIGPVAYQLPLLVFVTAVAVVPVLVLFSMAFAHGGTSGLSTALADPLNRQALGNSVEQGGISAVAALLAGYPLGVLLGRYGWRGKAVVRSLLIVPFLLPSLVVVLGVQDLLGPGGLLTVGLPSLSAVSRGVPGIVLVNVMFNVPLVALLTAVGVESASAPLEESLATLGASPVRCFRKVWGAPSLVGAAAGGLLTFVFSALSFAPPLLLCGPRCYTLEARVWALAQVLADPYSAALLAAVTVGALLVPTVAYLLLLDRVRATRGFRERRSRPLPWREPWVWPFVGAAALTLGAILLLLSAVLYQGLAAASPPGGPGSALVALFGAHVAAQVGVSTPTALVNSLALATGSAGIALVLGIVAGFHRSPGRAVRAYRWVPVLVSPVVLALALSEFWRPVFGGSSEAWLLILLAQATLAIPLALPGLELARAGVSPRLREAATGVGARPFTAYADAELPAVRGALITTGLFAFALSLGEFTATNFLSTPSFTTLPVELYHLDALRQVGPASALAAVLVVVSLLAFYGLQRGGERVLV